MLIDTGITNAMRFPLSHMKPQKFALATMVEASLGIGVKLPFKPKTLKIRQINLMTNNEWNFTQWASNGVFFSCFPFGFKRWHRTLDFGQNWDKHFVWAYNTEQNSTVHSMRSSRPIAQIKMTPLIIRSFIHIFMHYSHFSTFRCQIP